jgi:RHS repeat-associated protein
MVIVASPSSYNGPNFVLAVPHINFTFPTNGTTTPNFANWQLQGDTLNATTSYKLQVQWDDATDPMQSSTITASGTTLMAGVNVPKPTSSLDYTYDGTIVPMNATGTLSFGTSTVATTSLSFNEQTTVAPLNCSATTIQCVSYQYDNDGNITQITDQSAASSSITVSYTYDNLNRLLVASSSNAASGGNYRHVFTYDALGNILTGPAGTYSYGGASYADPDAVTSITLGTSTKTFSYDQNGNLTNSSSGFHYTWDYNNRLLSAYGAGATSTYGYDFAGQRALVTTGTSTTIYPATTYVANGTSTITKNIYANGVLVATVQNATATSTSGGGNGTISLVQQATSATSAYVSSVTTTLSSAPRAGDTLILIVGSGVSISSIVGGGVTWQKAIKSNSFSDAEIWYGLNSSGSGTNVTTTFFTCAFGCYLSLSEWSGVATSSAIDATSSRASAGVSTMISPTSTTSNANDLIITAAKAYNPVVLTSGPTGAFTALNTASSSNMNYAYDVVNTAVSTSTSWTFASNSGWFDSVIAAFKAGSGGSSGTSTTSTVVSYISTDILGGSNVVTNSAGSVVETLSYYPYGGIRIDNKAGANVARKYIGQMYDGQTQLDYLNARYYDGSRGQFISEDPMFLGNPNAQNLQDPQSLNAYSYAEDSPITKKDPTGKQDYNPEDYVFGFEEDYASLEAFIQNTAASAQEYTPSEAEQIALLNDSTQAADPAMDLSKVKWIEMVGNAPTYGLDTAPIRNGVGGEFMAPNLTSPFLQISAPIVSTIAVGTIAYRSSQGVTDQEDPNPPTAPHISSQPSSLSASGRSASTYSGGGYSQSQIASLNSVLNQLTSILNQLQSIVASQSASNGSTKK